LTELAHGSNVAGLETTATLDERTDEFVVHTPHLGATKWWIGGEPRVLFMTLLEIFGPPACKLATKIDATCSEMIFE
jgi:alkylation response protein AidB-like acyl-CoA dehydrogenase